MPSLKGKLIVVTGAANGIGLQTTLLLLRRSARVAAIDISAPALAALTTLALENKQASLLTTHEVNITDRAAVVALPEQIVAAHDGVPISGLVNNAGVIQPFKEFLDLSFDDIDRMVNVNLVGMLNMTKVFLPHLTAQREASLVNVSSMGGFLPFPGQSMYSATKAAVKLITEALFQELTSTSVRVTCVMPGAVETNISKNSGIVEESSPEEAPRKTSSFSKPEEAARRIIEEGLEGGRLYVLIGKDAKVLWRLNRWRPEWSVGMIRKQVEKAMPGMLKKGGQGEKREKGEVQKEGEVQKNGKIEEQEVPKTEAKKADGDAIHE